MIADSLIYLKEYNEITAKNRNEKNFDTADQFLSGPQKKSPFTYPNKLVHILWKRRHENESAWETKFRRIDTKIHKKKLLFLHIKITI